MPKNRDEKEIATYDEGYVAGYTDALKYAKKALREIETGGSEEAEKVED